MFRYGGGIKVMGTVKKMYDFEQSAKYSGLQHIEKRVNIPGESMIMITRKKVIFLILTHYTERCRKNHLQKEENRNLKFY